MSKIYTGKRSPRRRADAEAAVTLIYEAFRGIAEAHGFPPDFPSVKAAVQLAGAFIAHPSVFAVVAEVDQQVVGSNFLERATHPRSWPDYRRSILPARQDRPRPDGSCPRARKRRCGVRWSKMPSTPTIALYTSVGFDVKEPLQLLQGTPRSKPARVSRSGP